jgi:hypothetical protein
VADTPGAPDRTIDHGSLRAAKGQLDRLCQRFLHHPPLFRSPAFSSLTSRHISIGHEQPSPRYHDCPCVAGRCREPAGHVAPPRRDMKLAERTGREENQRPRPGDSGEALCSGHLLRSSAAKEYEDRL